MRLILIRHGQTQSNVDHIIDTDAPGPGLTALGREQAAAIPGALEAVPIDAIYVSTLRRTEETAAPIAAARALEPRVREGIREIRAGLFEGKSDKQSVHDFVSTELSWVRGELDRRMPGGEDGHETLGRFDAVVAEAAASHPEAVAFVSHGSMIRTWSGARAHNVDVKFVYKNPLRNTGVVILNGEPGGDWTVERWDDQALAPVLDDPGQAGPVADDADE